MSKDRVFFQFAVTPFLPISQPALGVSSLVAVLRQQGFTSNIRYLNIDFGRRIGWDLNALIGESFSKRELLVGEIVFATALWDDAAPAWSDVQGPLEQFCLRSVQEHPRLECLINPAEMLAQLKHLYGESPQIIRAWAEEILNDCPHIIGFSSTFQQNVASLSLAKQLRRHVGPEELLIVFGGANCEADMGRAIADNFPFVDHVVSGESEHAILDIAKAVSRPESTHGSLPRFIPGQPVMDMNALPFPIFDDYFSAVISTGWDANLVAESSRGCWWGMKSHCTFCGLNGNTMAFRSKRPARFAEELRTLQQRHGPVTFMMTDNIMDMKYLTSLLPELISSEDKFRLFYETKANLRKDQLETMVAAGVVWIQPGIESLSTPILSLMGKGTTCLQNIQVLKWAEEFEMRLSWNLLCGFPGEPAAEYDRMAVLAKQLVHLPAPMGNFRIRLDRFSPYWRSPEFYGLQNVRHVASYDLAYSGLPALERERLAYFFQFDYKDGREPDQYCKPLSKEVSIWREAYARKATLETTTEDGRRYIVDSRWSKQPSVSLINDRETLLLRVLDNHCNASGALRRIAEADPNFCESEVAALLVKFTESGWVVKEGDQFLSVVLDRTERERVVRQLVSTRLENFGFSGCESYSDAKFINDGSKQLFTLSDETRGRPGTDGGSVAPF